MESISLPSRLHQLGGNTSGSRAGFLNSIEAALNVNGNQNISSVQMSIANPATLQKRNEEQMSNLDERGGKSDDRMGMQGRSNTEIDRPATDSHAAKLDIDFLPPWSDGFLRRASHHDHGHSNRRHHCYDHETSREHIFSQVETLRGLGMSGIGAIGGHNEGGRQEELFDNRTNRMQRRLAALPILEKYVVFLTVFHAFPVVPLSLICLHTAWCLFVYGLLSVSVLCAVHRASGMAYACTLTHPKNPQLGFYGQSVATRLQLSG